MNDTISRKINNTEYAPGIATYGNSGDNGARGDGGNAIYYTSFNIISGEDLPSFKKAVREQKLPVKDGANINREFQNGDYFFDKFGNIFRLTNIDDLKNHPNLGTNYLRYFRLIGKIKPEKTFDNIFTTVDNSNRLSLNGMMSGIDINSAESDLSLGDDSENYPIRVISNNQESDNINMLHMTAFHNYDNMPDFKIYYDTVRNVWHFDSDVPVVVDSELTINTSKNSDINIDDYSPVIISDMPITVFYNYCRNISWAVNGTYGIQLLNFPNFPDLMLQNMRLKVITTINNKEQTYFISMKDSRWDKNMRYTSTFNSNYIKQVSLVHNIEVIIDKHLVPKKYLNQQTYSIKDPDVFKQINFDNTKLVQVNPKFTSIASKWKPTTTKFAQATQQKNNIKK